MTPSAEGVLRGSSVIWPAAADAAKRKPSGSKPGERRGGHAPGTPNKATAIISAAMNAVAANAALHSAITPLEFMLGMMADPNVDPSLRFKAAQAAAPFVHPKPTGSPAPDSGPMVINGRRSIEDVALVADAERQSVLQGRVSLKDLLGEDGEAKSLGGFEIVARFLARRPPYCTSGQYHLNNP
jgi:hypothetical protein